MTATFEIRTRLPGALHVRSEAWRFVADFAAHWQQPLRAGDGWSVRELEAAEQRLRLVLPAALRETYLLLGRRTDLTSNHDTLLNPDELHVVDGALVSAWRTRVPPPGAFWCRNWATTIPEP